jgi:hypothetical protein
VVFEPWPGKARVKQRAVDDLLDKWLHDLTDAAKGH